MLGVGSALIKASISSSIVGGYAGSIVRGASEASGALGTSESPPIGLGEEERQTHRIVVLLDRIREAMLASYGDGGGWFIVDITTEIANIML
jgi:hypothetical protein